MLWKWVKLTLFKRTMIKYWCHFSQTIAQSFIYLCTCLIFIPFEQAGRVVTLKQGIFVPTTQLNRTKISWIHAKLAQRNSSQKFGNLVNFIIYGKHGKSVNHVSYHRKPKCVPFQWHLIHYNLLLLRKDMASWIRVDHKSNVPKWKYFIAHSSTR